MNVIVVGGGAWGPGVHTGSCATAGTRSPIATRATLDDAPYEEADLVVLAVPVELVP